MSWLFDQLAELSCADRVEVVIGFDLGQRTDERGSIDVAELLVRAARLPGTSMVLLPAHPNTSTLPLEGVHHIEAEMTESSVLVIMVGEMLKAHGRHGGVVLRFEQGRFTLEQSGRPPDRDCRDIDSDGCENFGWIVARGVSNAHRDLAEIDPPALRISVGLNPKANVKIEDTSGFVSLLDAFVTLREFALDSVPLRESSVR